MAYSDAQIMEALNQSTCETLENLAFTELVSTAEAALSLAPDACLGARIPLGEEGTLDLILEKRFLGEVGGTLFSAGPESLGREALADTLNEILNIIAGRFLEKLHQGASDFKMGLPSEHADFREWNALPLRQVFSVEGAQVMGVGLAAASPAVG